MSNPILQSEHFDSAAYTLSRALDNFRSADISEAVGRFALAVAQFREQIDRVETIVERATHAEKGAE